MGMFDYVKVEIPCPYCGETLNIFQSQDGPRCLATLEYWEVDNFYTSCPKCDKWVEYLADREGHKLPLSAYTLVRENNV